VEFEISPKAAEIGLYSVNVPGEPTVHESAEEISFFLSGKAAGTEQRHEVTGFIQRKSKAFRLLHGEAIFTGICESK